MVANDVYCPIIKSRAEFIIFLLLALELNLLIGYMYPSDLLLGIYSGIDFDFRNFYGPVKNLFLVVAGNLWRLLFPFILEDALWISLKNPRLALDSDPVCLEAKSFLFRKYMALVCIF